MASTKPTLDKKLKEELMEGNPGEAASKGQLLRAFGIEPPEYKEPELSVADEATPIEEATEEEATEEEATEEEATEEEATK